VSDAIHVPVAKLLSLTRSLSVTVGRCDLCMDEACFRVLRPDPRWASLFDADDRLRCNFFDRPVPQEFWEAWRKVHDTYPQVPCVEFSYDDETVFVCGEHLKRLAEYLTQEKVG
jgi:hypothetical protein